MIRANYWRGLVASVALAAYAASAGGVTVQTQDFMVPALDAGIQLHLRNLGPAKPGKLAADKIVLFVHGATFPSTVAFDFDMPGGSWMKFMAERGYDVYALDIRGYGGSTRPSAMTQEPASNPPFADVRDASRDISATVDFILKRRGVRQLVLIGWSWGTTTTAVFAAEHPDKLDKLVLVSPVWLPMVAPTFTGAYRTGTRDSARSFMIRGIPQARVEEISPQAQFERWWAATLATDPEGARRTPPVLRSPNGAMKDFAEIWAAGNTAYDPARISAPTLLVVGEWDAITPPAMALELFKKLTNAAQRRVVILSEGTHFIALEKNRMHLIHEVQGFLDEAH